jgi:hypothetical protein
MSRPDADAELCRVRDIALKQAAECRASSGALYRLVAHLADFEARRAHPAALPALLESLRCIWSAAALIERSKEKGAGK